MVYFREEGAFEDYILIIHGLGEHSGRYWKMIERALSEKLSVVTFDLPGHGKSRGIRGHTSFKKIFKIIDEIVDRFKKPPIIFGHSLGGLIAARYVEETGKARMLILSSPSFSYDKEKVTQGLIELAKFLSFILPFLPMNNRIDPKKLSRNEKTVEDYIKDPLVHDKISVKLAVDFFNEVEKAIHDAGKIKVPTLVIVGTEDKVTPPEGARRFYENLKVEDKAFVEFKGAYHEIFEDPEHSEEFYDTIFGFIKERLGR